MKSKKTLIAGALLVCLSTGIYYSVSNATELTKEQKKEIYNKVQTEFVQERDFMKKQLEENPNDPQIAQKMENLKQKASMVNTLAKEVDTEAYYKHKVKSFIAALEGTINDETMAIEDPQSTMEPETTQKLKKVIEEKKALLTEAKKMDIDNHKNPQQVYEDLKAKVLQITVQMRN